MGNPEEHEIEVTSWRQRVGFGLAAVLGALMGGLLLRVAGGDLLQAIGKNELGWKRGAADVAGVTGGLLLLWIAWTLRVWFLPYRYVIDAASRACGYRWRGSWIRRVDLSGFEELLGEVHLHRHSWSWLLKATSGKEGREVHLMNSPRFFASREEARSDCESMARRFGQATGLPFRITA